MLLAGPFFQSKKPSNVVLTPLSLMILVAPKLVFKIKKSKKGHKFKDLETSAMFWLKNQSLIDFFFGGGGRYRPDSSDLFPRSGFQLPPKLVFKIKRWVGGINYIVLQKKSGLSQKRDQPILVAIGSQNENPLADFLDQFVCTRYFSLKSGIPAISLLFSHSLKN